MAEISKITLPSGITYDIKDAAAREAINGLTGAMHYLGVTTSAITDGSSTNPIVIGGTSITAKNGDVIIYDTREYVFSDSDNKWHEFGSTGSLKGLAFKDTASGSLTPSGSVSAPTFTGKQATINSSFTPAGTVAISKGNGTANYTPQGSVSTPTVTVTPNTTTVNSITGVGSLPNLTTSVANETLTIGWSAGSLPTKGNNTTVVTGIKSATASQPSFTGTGVELKGTFSGTAGTATATYTPEGNNSAPKFTGTAGTVTVS